MDNCKKYAKAQSFLMLCCAMHCLWIGCSLSRIYAYVRMSGNVG